MPKLPDGLVTIAGRAGYYYRTQRGGKDLRIKLSNNLDEAKRKLRKIQATEIVGPARVRDAALAWLKGPVAQGRSEKFAALTKSRFEDYLEPLYGYRRLDAFRAEHCREYRSRLADHGLSPQSVRHILADLRCLLNWSVEEGLIARSPFPRAIMPKIQEKAPIGLTHDQEKDATSLPGDDGFELRVLIGTGMRWGEFQQAQASWLEGTDFVIHGATKSRKVRRVPIAPALAREIGQRVGRLCRFANGQTLAKRARKVVPAFTPHATRHTYAYRYLEAGGTIHALCYLMGHSSITVTMKYLRGLSELAQNEARRVVRAGG